MTKHIPFIFLDREFYLDLDSRWSVKDEEGHVFCGFTLLDVLISDSLVGITVCNFGIALGWY